MTATLCATGCERPTKARLCDRCREELADALASLAAWSKPPALLWNDDGTPRLLPVGNHGSMASSVFDMTSGRAALGGTKALAAELDTVRARQTRRGDQAGPRPAPDSKVWAPNRKADRVDRDLTKACQQWVALLSRGNIVAPHIILSGNVLARTCTWLLWHVHDIATHPQAGEAWRSFTDCADRLRKLVDRPEDRVYVGPCWYKPNPAMPGDGCQADLYAKPGVADVQCVLCGHKVSVKERRRWLEEHCEDAELPAVDACRVLATIGLTVLGRHVSMWATRGELVAVGRRNVGGHSRPTYRVGDVKALAVRAAQDPRAARRAEREARVPA